MLKRRLKVAPKYASLHPRPLKVFSQIRLQGAWLLAAGFAPGDVANVEVSGAGVLVITRGTAKA